MLENGFAIKPGIRWHWKYLILKRIFFYVAGGTVHFLVFALQEAIVGSPRSERIKQ
jgi:hypothetical protein